MTAAGEKEQQVRALREARAKRWSQKARATATVAELRQAIADVTKQTAVTKPRKAVTKPSKPVTKPKLGGKGGRPRVGAVTMTAAERQRRSRERRKRDAE